LDASAEQEAGYWMLDSEFRMLVIDGEWKRHLKSKIQNLKFKTQNPQLLIPNFYYRYLLCGNTKFFRML